MKFHHIFTLISFLSILFSGCNRNAAEMPEKVSGELILSGLSDKHWTYFSFETGNSVGTSTFLSEEEDAIWKERDDWDFAICGDYIKTNGGTSGNGLGGILKDDKSNFVTMDTAPESGYVTDTENIVK